MATSRRSSNTTQDTTFSNFSSRTRTQSLRSMFSRRRPSTALVEDGEEVLPYR